MLYILKKTEVPLWRENPFLTTTGTQLRRRLIYRGCMEIQG
jgi:hypothetical protein